MTISQDMTPEQYEAAMEQWRAGVAKWIEEDLRPEDRDYVHGCIMRVKLQEAGKARATE